MRKLKCLGILSLLVALAIASSCQRSDFEPSSFNSNTTIIAESGDIDIKDDVQTLVDFGVTKVEKVTSDSIIVVTSSSRMPRLILKVLGDFSIKVRNTQSDSVYLFNIENNGYTAVKGFANEFQYLNKHESYNMVLFNPGDSTSGFVGDIQSANVVCLAFVLTSLKELNYTFSPPNDMPGTPEPFRCRAKTTSAQRGRMLTETYALNKCAPGFAVIYSFESDYNGDGSVTTHCNFCCISNGVKVCDNENQPVSV